MMDLILISGRMCKSRIRVYGFGTRIKFYKIQFKNKFSLNYELPILRGIQLGNKGGGTRVTVDVFEALIHHSIQPNLGLVGGFNLNQYHYSSTSELLNLVNIYEKYSTFGLTGGIEFRPSKIFAMSLLYRPSIYSEKNRSVPFCPYLCMLIYGQKLKPILLMATN